MRRSTMLPLRLALFGVLCAADWVDFVLDQLPKPPNDPALKTAANDETVKTILLRGGTRMPVNGLGTCCRPTARGIMIKDAVKAYIKEGGKLIDTAMAYNNHKEIGEAVAASGVDRSKLWITSKVAAGRVTTYEQGLKAVDGILEELGMEYVDLLLIHSPKMGKDKAIDVWKSLIEARDRGKARAIGVSNFNEGEILALEAATGELPEVNQIQYHPWSSPEWHKTVRRLQKKRIVITAYNSLGGARFNRRKLDSTWLGKTADSGGMSVSQLLLRWALARGCAVIPGSSTPYHIAENLDLPPSPPMDERALKLIENEKVPKGWWGKTPSKYGDLEATTPWHDAAGKAKNPHRHEHRRLLAEGPPEEELR